MTLDSPPNDLTPTGFTARVTGVRRDLFVDALRRRGAALRRASILVPALILVLVVLLCFFGPTIFSLPNPSAGNLSDYVLPLGTPGHLLGTNQLGNDMLSRLLVGGANSLTIGVAATLLGLVVGSVIGMLAGYYQRFLGATLMRIMDVIFAFPDVILALAIAAYLGPSIINCIWAIGFFGIAGYARVVRAQTLRMVSSDFVVAARSSGQSTWRILLAHIAPNIAPPVLSYTLVALGHAMMAEAALSFLGLGVPIPTPSLGNIISSGQSFLFTAPQLVVLPSVLLFLTIASANLLSDALQARRPRS